MLLHVTILLFCTSQYGTLAHTDVHSLYFYILHSLYFYSCIIAVLLLCLFLCMCMSVFFFFYIVCTCLGIQCGQQRKNFIVQGNLLFLTVHMKINALNLEYLNLMHHLLLL